jgi:small-conductance mechanosensitive channel
LLNELIDSLGIPAPALSALVLGIVGAAHILLRWSLRRMARQQTAVEPSSGIASILWQWLSHGLHRIVPPLALIIWIHGLYLAARLMLSVSDRPVPPSVGLALTWAYGIALVCAAFWLLACVGRLIEEFLNVLANRSDNRWDDVMLPLAGRAMRHLLPLLALILAAPALAVSPRLAEVFGNATSVLLIGVVAFVLLQVIDAASAIVLQQYRLDVRDNLRARAITTQVLVLKKVAITSVGLFTLASMLMVFDSVRQFGASILASAGIAGIIVGFAAQRSIATLLAGFQIALTQPIRVDDVVIVENEWGKVEDITLTYVVVRIWDLRRLVVPITYFIERPFQNWTRTSADILGTVFLSVDYSVPLDALRAELTRILEASPLWDRKVNVLQVTEAKERSVEVRVLVSAADASLAWDLRCDVREKLLTFLHRNSPASLPRVRATLETVTG